VDAYTGLRLVTARLSGLELCKRLRALNNSLPVLMLTARDRLEDKVAGLDAGADDYLVKPFGMVELLVLRALQRRSPQIQPQQLQVASLTLDYGTRTVYRLEPNGGKQVIPLTNKGVPSARVLMKHPNQIVTSDQLESMGRVRRHQYVVAAQIRLLRRRLAV